ncbi:MAG: hypothetical protein AB7V77_05705, partial [Candidatus Woesearchaeota archaeon]
VKSALENKDYTKAKLIYKDAKKIYGKIARTSPKRKTLDLIIQNLNQYISDFAKLHDVSDDDESLNKISQDLEKNLSKNIAKNLNESLEEQFKKHFSKDLPELENLENLEKPTQIPKIEFNSSLNFPLNSKELHDKQSREREFLIFRQKLERESQNEFLKLKHKVDQEQEKKFKELSEKIKEQNKKEIEALKQTLISRFGKKYFEFEKPKLNEVKPQAYVEEKENKETNKLLITPKEEIQQTNKEKINLPSKSSKPEKVPKQTWTNKDDYILIGIIQEQLDKLKKFLKEKDYENSKVLYNTLKNQILKLNGYKKHKESIYHVLKKIGEFLEKANKNKENIQDKEEDSSNELENIFSNNEINLQPENELEEFKNQNNLYLEAVMAIKNKDKQQALKLLLDLAKENPTNRAIKIRLKEALSL